MGCRRTVTRCESITEVFGLRNTKVAPIKVYLDLE